MLFATRHTRVARRRASCEAAENDCRKDHDAGRGRVRRQRPAGTLSGSSNLDGWKTQGRLHSHEGGAASGHEPVDVASVLDAVQQIAELRAQLREKQSEVDVLAEALAYARGFSPDH
ncbi:hypothetical protein [Burkholderia sp. 9120]|uniref:hypothetical protein n=1 Tax=Burkholderia sp. 9120 TaxID=1500897 RepID=UPI0012E0812D|nr:hypothetical protein [Burkholderia sp. 9120]